jgi:hypothetical protein
MSSAIGISFTQQQIQFYSVSTKLGPHRLVPVLNVLMNTPLLTERN